MIVYGLNRWKFAKASATVDGSGDVHTPGEGDDGGVKKPPGDGQNAAIALSSSLYPKGEGDDRGVKKPPEDGENAAIARSPLMRPKSESDDPSVKEGRRARGSQKMQAVRSDENPGDHASRESQDSRLRRRRKPRTTRTLGRPISTS